MQRLFEAIGRFYEWLDNMGQPAWIIAIVFGFILFWPLGLILLFSMLKRRRTMFNSCQKRNHGHRYGGPRAQYNSAFEAYRDATLKRLEEERLAFDAYLAKLREAKDKEEFDAFMKQRDKGAEPA